MCIGGYSAQIVQDQLRQMQKALILDLDNLTEVPVTDVGSKAHSLARVRRSRVSVPPGFCITRSAFEKFVVENDIASDFTALTDASLTPNQLALALQTVRERIMAGHFDEILSRLISDAYRRIDTGGAAIDVIVRSSSSDEDLLTSLSAGQYLSLPNIREQPDLLNAVKRVWASQFTVGAHSYRLSKSLPVNSASMAVLVQEMVSPIAAGVAYTADVDNLDYATIVVECAKGTDVVSGVSFSRRWYIDKRSGNVTREVIGPHEDITLDSESLHEVVEIARRVEQLFNAPVDIEWLLSMEGSIVVVQARTLPFPRPHIRLPTVVPIRDAPYRSGKILAAKTNAKLDACVITDDAFRHFKANRQQLTDEITRSIREVFCSKISKGQLTVRPAYSSALYRSDMLSVGGPFSDSESILAYLRTFWDFVIAEGLDDYSSEVALLIHTFCAPFASAIVTRGRVSEATQNGILIEALYGYLDGLQCSIHDTYFLTEEIEPRLLDYDVPVKPKAVVGIRTGLSSLPPTLSHRAVISPEMCRAIAQKVIGIFAEFGTARIEILVLDDVESGDTSNAFVVWQIDRMHDVVDLSRGVLLRHDDAQIDPIERGLLLNIQDYADLTQLEGSHGNANWIGLVDIASDRLRDSQFVIRLAEAAKHREIPLVLRGAMLSHAACTLRDFRVKIYAEEGVPSNFGNGAAVMLVKAPDSTSNIGSQT